MHNSKRKFEEFDPNASDPEDDNFDPSALDSSPRRSKKNRKSRNKKQSRSKRARSGYRGSDIEDDSEDDSDSDSEADFESEESESEEEGPLNKAGRRTRKAAAGANKKHAWVESSESDEDNFEESEADLVEAEPATEDQGPAIPEKEEVDSANVPTATKRVKQSLIVHLSIEPERLAHILKLWSRQPSRSHTLDTKEEPASATSNSTPISEDTAEDMVRSTRVSRGTKGVPNYKEIIPDSDPVFDDEGGDDEDDATMIGAKVGPNTSDTKESKITVEEDDDDDMPITRRTRTRRHQRQRHYDDDAGEFESHPERSSRSRRLTRRSKKKTDASSDFEPNDRESEENSDNEKNSDKSDSEEDAEDSSEPKGRERTSKKTSKSKSDESADEEELDQDELVEELHELTKGQRSSRRRRQRSPSIIYEEPAKRRRAAAKPAGAYFMAPLNTVAIEEDEADDPAPVPARRRGGRGGANSVWERPLNSTYGPFGGATASGSLLGGPWGTGAAGGVDSDSSDDEMGQRSNAAGNVGAASGQAGGLLGGIAGGMDGNAPNVGKIKSHKALADADPLGVDMSVDFSKVGGLDDHIDKLKEMVQLPLLYPELFQRFNVTPPRGVLFHGPPGTGKTLLARALANSVTSGGKKISFYMRKGADALSKWVGEAEKQLRLLFEEARRTQPSIIFFDEIDGLAPVRSSKQEQIHASIVSTLLALMDGMDGRGQVIVIGATNRPDNIDPALRRPGRFDREFYFSLPDLAARRSILSIHTRNWGLSDQFLDKLADSTKGYGGADLRALCTEAALNSIQRAYPQIYGSKEKLVVDPSKINVHASDFMISIKNMIPSSQRSASSVATPLPPSIEPLLSEQLAVIRSALDSTFPRKKKTTALEEAMYEQPDDSDHGFGRETLNQEFERSRVFRPRLLIHGEPGMGQMYLAQALMHYLEGVHVQTFDLPSLLADGRSIDQVVVSQFTEIRRHKPSVIFIPNIDVWYATLEGSLTYVTFRSMLRAIPASEPVLVLATADCPQDELPPAFMRDIFGFTKKNLVGIEKPTKERRHTYFEKVASLVRKEPPEFPNPENRPKRKLEELSVAPPPPPREPSKEEIKALLKRDRQLLNQLKVLLQPIMDQINRRYRKFRTPVIPFSHLEHLYNQNNPGYVVQDESLMTPEQLRYKIVKDKYGVDVLFDNDSQKIYYNLETTTIEERLSNGFYARPKDFLFDIRTLAKDSRNIGDKERTLKANELVSNVEVDVASIESTSQVDWEALYQRQLVRAREAEEKMRKKREAQKSKVTGDIPSANTEDSDSNGPVRLGEQIPGGRTNAVFQVIDLPGPISNATSSLTTLEEDTPMTGMEDSSANLSAMPPSVSSHMKSLPLSQKSAVTSVPPGSSVSDFANNASVTKTLLSKPSTLSVSESHVNGVNMEDDHSLLDTQSNNSMLQKSIIGNNTSLMSSGAIAGRESTGSAHLSIGNSTIMSERAVPVSQAQIDAFLDQMTKQTSGCTIEQLVQIGRELMDEVWRSRGEWNRVKVLEDLTDVFNAVIGDIQHMQGALLESQRRE